MENDVDIARIAESRLPELLGKYQRAAFLKVMLTAGSERHSYADLEFVIVAAANFDEGRKAEVDSADVTMALEEASRLASPNAESSPTLTGTMKMLQGIRPPEFTAPIYQRLLQPFSHDLQAAGGPASAALFAAVQNVARGNLGRVEPLGWLQESMTVTCEDAKSLTALRPKAILAVDDDLIFLPYKLPEVVYHQSLRRLEPRVPRLAQKKGESLERLVASEMRKLGKVWTWIRSWEHEGREKDLLGLNGDAAVAVESKALRFRASSSDWSQLNALADLKPLAKAVEQVEHALGGIRAGHLPHRVHGGSRIPRLSHGLVIIDDPFAAYAASALENPQFLDPGSGRGAWRRRDVWIASVFDLVFLRKTARSMPVLMDYMRAHRARREYTMLDEPEAWYGYRSTRAQAMRSAGVLWGITEFPWHQAFELGLEKYGPEWLDKPAAVERLEKQGEGLAAFKLVQQMRRHAADTDAAALRSRAQAPMEGVDVEEIDIVGLMETWHLEAAAGWASQWLD